MDIQRSGEDYLETIYILEQKTHYVRSIDVAMKMNFSKPSVSKGMSILKSLGYITVAPDGQIILTESGLKRAEAVYSRHTTIRSFFIEVLGVAPETAEEDACKVEHVISEETFSKLREFMEEKVEQDKTEKSL